MKRLWIYELVYVSIWVLVGVAVLVVHNSCAQYGYNPAVPTTPEEAYLKARMTFNGLLQDYVDQKRMADRETRARWSKDIDPWFERGAAALALWGDAVRAADQASIYDQQQAYLEIKNQLLQLMLKELT